jgi:hypothetical protein
MSTRTTAGGTPPEPEERIGVGVEIAGTLVARAGLRRAQLALPAGATVADAIDRLAETHGAQVSPALLEGRRLRQGTVAVRRTDESIERAGAETPLDHGDRLRFEIADY